VTGARRLKWTALTAGGRGTEPLKGDLAVCNDGVGKIVGRYTGGAAIRPDVEGPGRYTAGAPRVMADVVAR